MTKCELTLQGLDCPVCSATIEREAGELAGVDARLDFPTRTLSVTLQDGTDYESTLGRIREIVRRHEPGVAVEVCVPAGEAENRDAERDAAASAARRRDLLRLGVGGALSLAGWILRLPPAAELALFLAAYLTVGGGVLLRAGRSILHGQVFNENFLMGVATLGAFAIGEYPEGVAVMLFYRIGELFESMAVDRSRRSIAALMDIRPDHANRIEDGGIRTVPPEEIRIGDRILVRPGERFPLDGVVVEGRSEADTAALTGESVPRVLEPGDEALSGFVNRNGALTVEVTKVYSDSTVARILDLVRSAGGRKAQAERFITKFARYYTPAVVSAALALAVLPPLLLPGADWGDWIYRALFFLVVSCPCALVISIPLGFFGGIGGASRRGILIKGAPYLEALNRVDTVVFDKTGTLTRGVFAVTAVRPEPGFTEEELLALAAAAERHSTHPVASAILRAHARPSGSAETAEAGEHGEHGKLEKHGEHGEYEEIPGQGVRAVVGGTEILAGSARLLESRGVACPPDGIPGTVVHVAADRRYAGGIAVSDELKPDAAHAVRSLKALGVRRTVLLTGDRRTVGDRIGRELELDEVHAELLPGDKVARFEDIAGAGNGHGGTVFVGDGINDAPVLARADVGIAMGGLGSDAAVEAADVVILTDEPSKVGVAIRIARKTRRIVVQNILAAMGIKALFLLLGALGAASLWEAVFADTGVAVLAILNAMRGMNTRGL
ncbi:MAG: cadmium-translocating P-type ATPase [Clostridia bacterium]|nr:cadmium-translocating P-type ATPase [Clostridia bacterium]